MYDHQADTPGKRYTVMCRYFVWQTSAKITHWQMSEIVLTRLNIRLSPNWLPHPVYMAAITVKESLWDAFMG